MFTLYWVFPVRNWFFHSWLKNLMNPTQWMHVHEPHMGHYTVHCVWMAWCCFTHKTMCQILKHESKRIHETQDELQLILLLNQVNYAEKLVRLMLYIHLKLKWMKYNDTFTKKLMLSGLYRQDACVNRSVNVLYNWLPISLKSGVLDVNSRYSWKHFAIIGFDKSYTDWDFSNAVLQRCDSFK